MAGLVRIEGLIGASAGMVAGEFSMPSAVTPVVAGSTIATITTNAASWNVNDRLIVVSWGGRDATLRTWQDPAEGWASPTETWALESDGVASTATPTQSVQIGAALATAQSGEAVEDAVATWSSTMFNPCAALLVVGGSCIIRQTAKANDPDAGTTITTTFGAAVLSTSLILSFCAHRSTATFTIPGSFTDLGAEAGTLRGAMAGRIGHGSTAVQWTGLSSANAKAAISYEIARPGQEL